LVLKLVGPSGDISEVCHTAARIRRFAEAITQGHSFGITPGEEREPWSLEFQRSAISLYTDAISWDYAISVASTFRRRARLMDVLAVRSQTDESWSILQQYLSSVATAILDSVPVNHERAWPLPSIGHVAPPVLPFDVVAALIHPDGVARLTKAALDVEVACLGAGAVDPGE